MGCACGGGGGGGGGCQLLSTWLLLISVAFEPLHVAWTFTKVVQKYHRLTQSEPTSSASEAIVRE